MGVISQETSELALQLWNKHKEAIRLMAEALALLEQGDLPLTPQPAEGVTYARKIDKAETRTRQMERKLKGVEALPEDKAKGLLGAPEPLETQRD